MCAEFETTEIKHNKWCFYESATTGNKQTIKQTDPGCILYMGM